MDTKLPTMTITEPEQQHLFEQLQQELERLLDRLRGTPTITTPAEAKATSRRSVIKTKIYGVRPHRKPSFELEQPS